MGFVYQYIDNQCQVQQLLHSRRNFNGKWTIPSGVNIGEARSGGVTTPIKKKLVPRKAQICNNFIIFKGTFEMASATAISQLEKGVSRYPKGVSLILEGGGQTIPLDSTPYPNLFFSSQ